MTEDPLRHVVNGAISPGQPDFNPVDCATRGIIFERPQDLDIVLAGVRALLRMSSS
jgi:hypothetical protein